MKFRKILSLTISACMAAGTMVSAVPEAAAASPADTNLDSSYVEPWGGGRKCCRFNDI